MVNFEGTFPIPSIGADILREADEIAEFLYGDRKCRRNVYNIVETKRIPHSRLGATIWARNSVLMFWIVDQKQNSDQV